MGCPRAMAPPLTLSLASSSPSSRATATDWAAKASLASTRSMSATPTPARSMALRQAGTGPTPMILGSTPAWPQPVSLAMGVRPYLRTASPLATIRAAPPSLRPEALAAVTRWMRLPQCSAWTASGEGSKVWTTVSLRSSGPTGKAPRSFATLSAVVPGLGYSSTAKSTVSRFRRTGTGTISSAKRPLSMAATALHWEDAAKASSSSRVMPQRSQTFSAVVPMW